MLQLKGVKEALCLSVSTQTEHDNPTESQNPSRLF